MKLTKTLLLTVGVLAVGWVAPCAHGDVTLTTLVSFGGTNGANPGAGLVQGKDGNFYGTTAVGGANGYGSLFQLTPSGTLATLISFDKTNGANPGAALVLGSDDAFYGTTDNGGTTGYGTIFKVTTNGTLTTLVSFQGTDGSRPHASLVQGQDGKFYGTTEIGGTNQVGTAFQMLPNGTLTSLVSFDTNGYSPRAGLVQAADGNFYGTTYSGGAYTNQSSSGYGTVFKLTTNGTLTTLASFNGTNGAYPQAALLLASDGNFYGTTTYFTNQSGSGYGTVFKLTTNGTLITLASFNGTNGANPQAALLLASNGNFYGTTKNGGAFTNLSGSGYGTVFKLTTNGTLITLASFNGTNGANPQAALLLASDGNFYGTTKSGGAYTNQFVSGNGTVFKLTTNGTLTTLVSFNGTNGARPLAGLVQALDGSLYGTTANGGTNDSGTIFRLAFPPPPEFQAVKETGATLALTWSATVGETYQMWYKTNLNQINWNNLGSTIIATNASMTTLDATGPDQQRFYRIELLP